jgi:hypothetical protein
LDKLQFRHPASLGRRSALRQPIGAD